MSEPVVFDEPSLTVVFDEPSLTVVFDDTCELCRRCHHWLAGQDAIVALRFLAASDPIAVAWLGDRLPIGQELVVVDNQGAAWVGSDAFIAVLSVLRRYTSLAQRLQRPALRPLARQAFHAVSLSRGSVSGLLAATGNRAGPARDFATDDDADLADQLARLDHDLACVDGSCSIPPAAS